MGRCGIADFGFTRTKQVNGTGRRPARHTARLISLALVLFLAAMASGCHLQETIDANDRAWQRAGGEPRFLKEVDDAIRSAKRVPGTQAGHASSDAQTSVDLTDVKRYYDEKNGAAPDPAKLKAIRDEAIYYWLAQDDQDFENYYLYFGIGQRSAAFENDLVVLGLSTAGAITHGEQAKTVLAGMTALFTGARVAFDKEIFFQNTFPALVSQMKASRAEKRKEIETNLAKSDANYPLVAGLSDVREYSSLGTLTGILPVLGHPGTAGANANAALDQFAKSLGGQTLPITAGAKTTFKVTSATWSSDYTSITLQGTATPTGARVTKEELKPQVQLAAVGAGPDVAGKVASADIVIAPPPPPPPPAAPAPAPAPPATAPAPPVPPVSTQPG